MVARLLELALTNAGFAAVLAVVVWLIGRWCRRPQWMYGLWLLVLLKLVTPPLLNVPIHISRAEPVANDHVATPQTSPTAPIVDRDERSETEASSSVTALRQFDVQTTPADVATFNGEAALSPLDHALVDRMASPETTATSAADSDKQPLNEAPARMPTEIPWWRSISPANWIIAIWFGGSTVWLVLVIYRSATFSRLLREAGPVPAWLAVEAHNLSQRLGLGRLPQLRVVDSRLSPLLWAVPGKACVVLPEQLVRCAPRSQVVTLLAHELAHFRRGDHYCRWFELLVLSLFWWNPVAWWARRQLHRAEEECCDTWVLWALPEQSREYAGAILETLDFLSGAQPVLPALASGLGAADVLERRLTMILHDRLPRHLSLRSQFCMLLVAALVLPLSGRAQDAPATEAPGDPAPVAGNEIKSQGLGGSITSATAPTPAPSAGLAPATAASAAVPPAPAPSADVRPSGSPGSSAANAIGLAPPVALPGSPYQPSTAGNDQSIEARMDRLEKMVSDIAAAVGRGGGPAVYPRYSSANNYPVPAGVRMAVSARPNSVAEMKKRRVDLEVQIDAMREQIERLQQEMQKLEEGIANHDSNKRAKDDLPKPTELRRQ